jgi:phosphomannomutase
LEQHALITAARAWMAQDPDPRTRAEVEALLATGRWDELTERFAAPMEFGTAGLRGLVGAGPARMNIATVTQAAAAVVREALANARDAATRGIVVGRDARMMSDELAAVAAEVFAGHGVKVHWVAQPAPTPVAAYLGRHLGAAAIAIVTASHNPPEYNGFKVYGESASQIVPPQDVRIRELRDGITDATTVKRLPFTEAVARGLIRIVTEAELQGYLAAIDAQCLADVPPPAQVSAVTTALHGVGHRWVHDALARRGHRHLFPVMEQAYPDGRFPTVRFPNPEEKGALDLALDLARDKYAELILANDPDTDRLCVAVRDAGSATGYRVLTGNEVGLLLADWVLSEGPKRKGWPAKPFAGCSLVSTAMLEPLVKARGATYAEVLTGFKWIWHEALLRQAKGETFVFGFEEALGYCVGQAVRDKDGVGAAQALMDLAAYEKARGRTLIDRLDAIAAEIGASITDQVSLTLPGIEGMARIGRIMKAWREAPPASLAGVEVVRRRDLAGPDADEANLPRGDVLTWWLSDRSRIVARPSGTEPKLKVYLETVAPVGAEGLAAARKAARGRCDALASDIRARIEQIA